MSPGRLAAFLLTSAVVIAIPGPSVLFAVGRALAAGRRVAVLSVIGNALGEYMQVIAVAFGAGALAEQSVAVFTTMKLIAGCYLIALGVRTFRRRREIAAALAAPVDPAGDAKAFAQGLVVGATNPKTIVFLAAILPQFVTGAGAAIAPQIMFLGLLFVTIAVLSDTVWVLAAGRLRSWLSGSPRRLEAVGGAGGIAIAALGTGLLVTGRKG